MGYLANKNFQHVLLLHILLVSYNLLVTLIYSILLQLLSPLILQANCMSLGMIVTHLAWIAHKLLSLNRLTRYASLASCNAIMAVLWNRTPVKNCWPTSWTNCMNSNFLINSSVLFWYFLISLSAMVPGLYLHFVPGFSTFFFSGADTGLAFFPFTTSFWASPLPTCLLSLAVNPLGYLLFCHYNLIILNTSVYQVHMGSASCSRSAHFLSSSKIRVRPIGPKYPMVSIELLSGIIWFSFSFCISTFLLRVRSFWTTSSLLIVGSTSNGFSGYQYCNSVCWNINSWRISQRLKIWFKIGW